jgi:hypothetical protein
MKVNVAFALLLVVEAIQLNTDHSFLAQNDANVQKLLNGAQVHKDEAVPPVSTTMKCIINLTIQYFLVYTALAVVRTYNELNNKAPLAQAASILNAAATTVNYAPMLSVLFLGTRMRALQLSGGEPDAHNLPQPFVKMAMQSCAWSVLVQTVMVVLIPVVLGGEPKVDEDGTPKVEGNSTLAQGFTAVRYLAMLGMYGGFTTVCVGAAVMEAPKSVYPDGAPPVSPAVACTMNLCFQYFAVYLGIAVMTTYHQFRSASDLTKKIQGTLQLCQNTVSFAPMLCILFIGARMRALQIDPVNGNPQKWAQTTFYVCAYSVLAQCLLLLLIPLVLDGKLNKGSTEGDVTFTLENPTTYAVLNAVRYACMLALYSGFTVVIYSVCVIKNPNGPTPAVSPAMQCVMNLTIQFFFVYLMLWVFVTAKQFTEGMNDFFNIAIPTLDSARATVQFCPMLSILFVGLRMRALQITQQKGAPQGWAQQGMFLCTYSVMVQVLMVLVLPMFTRSAPKTDADGNIITEGSGIMASALVALRYLAFVALYGGAVTVVTAVFLITPETATGTGALIPGVEVPVPPAVPA